MAIKTVASALFEMACSKQSPAATIYWLKIMGGTQWRQDKNYGVEHSGEVQHNVVADRQKLVDQLRRLNDTKPELMAELRELRRREHEILDQVHQTIYAQCKENSERSAILATWVERLARQRRNDQVGRASSTKGSPRVRAKGLACNR